MPPPGSFTDGAPGYGSRLLTLSNYGPILAESIAFNRPTQEARDQLTDGEPNRARYTQGPVTLTCTLQAAAGTAFPVGGETFTDTFDTAYGPEMFVMAFPGYTFSNDATQLRKVNVTFYKVYRGSITTYPTPAA